MVKSVVLPASWHQEQLKDLCLYPGEYGLNSPAIPLSPDLPLYIRITDIDDDGRYLLQHRATVIYSGKQKLLQKNDLLFARTGATVGKTYLHQDTSYPTAFAGYLIRFVPNTAKIIPYFLFLYCHTAYYWNWIKIFKARSGQPGISADEYGKMLVPCPPIAEQHRIVEVLETWDKAIQLTRELIEQKELQKKYLMQQLLSGRIRLKGFVTPWRKTILGNLLKEKSLRNKDLAITRVLSVTNDRGFVLPQEQFSRQVASKNVSNYKVVLRGEFAYNPSRINVGSISFLATFEFGILSPMYVVFSCSEQILPQYFKYWIKTYEFISKVKNAAQGSVRATVDFQNLSTIKMNYPANIKEQLEISKVLSQADKEIDLLRQKLAKLEEQKKGLMQVLLTGKVRLAVRETK